MKDTELVLHWGAQDANQGYQFNKALVQLLLTVL